MVVGIDDAKLGGVDVAEDGSGKGHGASYSGWVGASVEDAGAASATVCMTRATAPRTPAWSERSARRMGMTRSLG